MEPGDGQSSKTALVSYSIRRPGDWPEGIDDRSPCRAFNAFAHANATPSSRLYVPETAGKRSFAIAPFRALAYRRRRKRCNPTKAPSEANNIAEEAGSGTAITSSATSCPPVKLLPAKSAA